MKRLLLLCLIASFAPQSGQSQESLPANDAALFTAAEERQILDQLYELRRARAEIGELKDYIARDNAIDEREKALAEERLKLADDKISLANRETALQREKAETYELLYRSVTRKTGFGCKIARVVTLGIVRCR